MMVVKESVELELVYGQIEKGIGGFEWLNQTRWVEASQVMMTEVSGANKTESSLVALVCREGELESGEGELESEKGESVRRIEE